MKKKLSIIIIVGTADPIIDGFIHPSLRSFDEFLVIEPPPKLSPASEIHLEIHFHSSVENVLFSHHCRPILSMPNFYFIFYFYYYYYYYFLSLSLSLSVSLSLIFDVAQVVGGFYSWKYLAKFWLWMRYMKEQTFQLFEKHFSQIWLWTRFLFFLSTFWCSQSGQFIIHEKI